MSTSGTIDPVKQRSLLVALGVFVVAVALAALAVLAAPLRFAGTGGVPGASLDALASPDAGAVSSASPSV